MRKVSQVALAVALGALLLVPTWGCGGGSSNGPLPGPTLLNLNSGQAAQVVIGQADFAGSNANQGGAAGANTSNSPGGSASGSLFVAEQFNNRVLGFITPPVANDAGADFVLGQPDFGTTSAVGAPTAIKFHGPWDVCVSGGRLFMVSHFQSRVLIWNAVPAASGVPANIVIGAPNLTTTGGGTTQTTLNLPDGICVAGGKIVVADTGNNRVMIWTSVPGADNAPADLVLGQALFTTSANGKNADELDSSGGVWTDGTRLVVADTDNNRVLIWNSFPTMDKQPADLVIGQAAFGAAGSAAGATGMNGPKGVTSNGVQIFVADTGNNRVLVFNAFPAANGAAADAVLGQAGFAGTAAAAGASGMSGPEGVHVNGMQLFVSDTGNHRTLIFNGN